jgi:NTP pyrophosphatase (non-canonical NTP hydrolase)
MSRLMDRLGPLVNRYNYCWMRIKLLSGKPLKQNTISDMRDPEILNAVVSFHRTFGQPVILEPAIPSKERCDLRISLIQEELNELKEAIEANDLVEVADALADLQYVLAGTIIEFGLGDKFKEVFDEVQRSNMSKACPSVECAEKTVEYYRKERGVDSYICERGGQFTVLRLGDDKVLKSINYSPANIKSILKTNK